MSSSNIVREYAKLGRIHSSVLSGLAPAIGAMVMGLAEFELLIILFLIGIMTHIFGFSANEYLDLEIDKRSAELSEKPLVKGTISKKGAIGYMVGASILAYLLMIIYFIWSPHEFNLWEFLLPMIFLTLSWLSIGFYDLVSKKLIGSDLFLALWPFFLVLFGGALVSVELAPLVYIVAGLAFFQLFIQNIMAGLKDIVHDQSGGGRSTPLRFGIILQEQAMKVPRGFQAYIAILKMVYLVLIFLPFIVLWLDFEVFQMVMILALVVATLYQTIQICSTQRFERRRIIRAIGAHEILAYSIIPVMLMYVVGYWMTFALLVLPIIWLAVFLRLMYGRLMPEI